MCQDEDHSHEIIGDMLKWDGFVQKFMELSFPMPVALSVILPVLVGRFHELIRRLS
jgi:hypothetical protein